jgi:RNA polymerase sigma factor (sigma-70 family)
MNGVIRHLRRAVLPGADGVTDGRLLEDFRARRDEAAFEALLLRHGPMVLGVCRRVLRQQQDAEDAFQATFLVLARKAASIRTQAVGNWLYGVAFRTAMKAKLMTAKRRIKERQAEPMPRPEPEEDWRELLPLLDRELNRLPDRYRAPVVLCELEGKTRKEAAGQLGLAEGTLSSRLARGRAILARRLGGRAPVAAVGVLALAREASAGVPAGLLGSTAGAVTGTAPARVAALTAVILKGMLLNKLLGVTALVLALVLVGLGAGAAALQAEAGQDEAAQKKPTGETAAAQKQTAEERELKWLEGTWEVISSVVGGNAEMPPDGRKVWQTFRGDTFTIRRGDTITAQGTAKVDARGKIKALDQVITEGTSKGRVLLSIYERLPGGDLRLCTAFLGGEPRPTEFTSDQGSRRVLQTLRRVKADDAQDETAQKERKQLEGTWEMISVSSNGKKDDASQRKTQLTFKDKTFTLVQGGKVSARGTFEIDFTKKPRPLDLTFTEGGLAGKTVPAIYEVKGDELWECFTIPYDARPTGFNAEKDSNHLLFIYRRVKPTDPGDEAIRKELKLLEGTWDMVYGMRNGEKHTPGKTIRITIHGDSFTAERIGTPASLIGKGPLKVDPTQKFKTIDFITTEGPGKGTKALMLYQLQGDFLMLCETGPDETRKDLPRPTEFSAGPGSGCSISYLRRVKPKE